MTPPRQPTLPPGVPALLTPAEVAEMYRTDAVTVTRWANQGRVEFVRLPGGRHRRYPSRQFAAILAITGWPLQAEQS